MATQQKETSFNTFLSSTPTLKELTEHVNVSTNWYIVGTMLDLDQRRLQDINGKAAPNTHKMIEMFNLWLDTTPTASRRQVLEALRVDAVEEITLAHKYEKHLRELHETTYTPPSTEAVSILQGNIQSLNEALVSPVQVSQLLYCKRCISEATLDEMERIDQSRSLDDKKTTLLTAMKETVSSDYRKLKDIVTVLSDVEQTRDIANEMMTKYEEKIPPEDDSTVVQPQEIAGSNEDRASDILTNNYGALSQSITEPVRMARLLNEEVISDEALSCVMSTRGCVSDSRAVLLKAVRDAVHSNYKHLELLVTVLRKFSETAHIGDIIFEDYRKHFNYDDDDVPESKIFLAERNSDFQQKPMSISSKSSSLDANEMDSHGNHEILFPRDMKKKFQEMKSKLGTTFFRVRRIFKSKQNVLDIDDVKELISDWFPDLKPQLSCKKAIGDVLDVLQRKCNISDISPLENLAFEFNIEDAKPIIKSYKEEAKNFSKSVSVSLCLGQELQAFATPSRLLCETVVFVFNWDPEEHTLQDINDVLDELEPLNRFKYHLQIDKVGPGRSVVITCYCPAEYTGSLITAVLDKIEILQKKGLKKFIVGNSIIWDATQVMSKNTEGTDLLVQINDLKAALRDRDERIMKLATFKELSENRLKEIEALKKDLEESRCINVQNEECLKNKVSSLKKELAEKENMLKQYSKDTKEKLEFMTKVSQERKQLKLKPKDNNIKEISSEKDNGTSIQTNGSVKWLESCVHLTNPSVDQCKEVISKLENKHKMIKLDDSASDSIQFLLPTILKRTIKVLSILSSLLTHDDILTLSSQLQINKSLAILALTEGSMSDDGVIALTKSLQYNKTLQYLSLQCNPGITSASALSLAELLLTNDTLRRIDLHHTNIDIIGVLVLMESLKSNNTLRELRLDVQHKEICSLLPYYERMKNILFFGKQKF